jgi:hypothetical protein
MSTEEKKPVETPVVYNNAADEIAAIELALKKAQLEDFKLQQEERKYSVQDLKSRLAEREVKELQKKQDREAQGRTFAQKDADEAAKQKVCTHKKGGVVTPRDMRVLSTGGNGQQYAIIKHQMINGDFWVRCLRCGKTWCPPSKSKFYFDKRGKAVPEHMGEFGAEKFKDAVTEYTRAVNFETNNSPSGSVQCRFSRYNETTGEWVDATQEYRELVKDSNLR